MCITICEKKGTDCWVYPYKIFLSLILSSLASENYHNIATDWESTYCEGTSGASLCCWRWYKIVRHLLGRHRNKREMRWTPNPCESKRLWGLYLAAPCGNDNGRLGSKRTTIHLNPGLLGKTHNPSNTHDPPADRQQGENGTLKARDKTQHPFLLFSSGSACLFNKLEYTPSASQH